jgi:TP901 family phage tail tape measure protein
MTNNNQLLYQYIQEYSTKGHSAFLAAQAQVNKNNKESTKIIQENSKAYRQNTLVTEKYRGTLMQQVNGSNKVIEKSRLVAKEVRSINNETGNVIKTTLRYKNQNDDLTNSWKTGIPFIDMGIKKMNALRWSMVNVGFAIGALAIMVSPFVIWTKQAMELEQQLKRIQVLSGNMTSSEVGSIRSELMGMRSILSTTELAGITADAIKTGLEPATAVIFTDLTQKMMTLDEGMKGAAGSAEDYFKTLRILDTLFAKQGYTVNEMGNIIWAVAKSTNTSIIEMSKAFEYVGGIGAHLNLEFSDLAATLGMLSQSGIEGTKAGRGLQRMFQDFIKTGSDGEKHLAQYGLTMWDANQELKQASTLMRDIYIAGKDLSGMQRMQLLEPIFGQISIRQVTALFEILSKDIDSITNLSEKSRTQTELLEKDWEEMLTTAQNTMKQTSKTFKDTFIGIGSNLLIGLTPFMSRVDKFLSKFKEDNKVLRTMGATGLATGGAAAITGMTALMTYLKRGTLAEPMIVKDISAVGGGGVKGGFFGKGGWDGLAVISALGLTSTGLSALESHEAQKRQSGGSGISSMEKGGMVGSSVSQWAQMGSMVGMMGGPKGLLIGGGIGAVIGLGMGLLKLSQLSKEVTEQLKKDSITAETYNPITSVVSSYNMRKLQLDTFKTTMLEIFDAASLKSYSKEYTSLLQIMDATNALLETGLGTNKAIKETIEEMLKVLEEAKTEILMKENALEEVRAKLEANKKETSIWQAKLKEVNDRISIIKDELSEINNIISTLSNLKFTGETAFTTQISEYDRFLKLQEFQQTTGMGPFEFIQMIAHMTNQEIEELLKSYETVEEKQKKGQNTYKAWQETIRETTRALIKEGNLSKTNLSELVKANTTLLLATERYSEENANASSQVRLLQDAYDLHYGYMHELVNRAIQEDNERLQNELINNGLSIDSHELVISKLREQWGAKNLLLKQLEDEEKLQSEYKSNIAKSTIEFNKFTAEINEVTNAIQTLRKEAEQKITITTEQLTISTRSEEGSSNLATNNLLRDALSGDVPYYLRGLLPEAPQNYSNMPHSQLQNTDWFQDTVSLYTSLWNDLKKYFGFAEGGIVTKPTRALIGEAGPEAVIPLNKLGNIGGDINITINGTSMSSDPREMAHILAEEIKKELNTGY